jgi:hypothetical protein
VALVSRSRPDLEKVLTEIQNEGGKGFVAPTDTGDRYTGDKTEICGSNSYRRQVNRR